ncbi:MBL fold metallo-hydrolase [Palleronia pelagia]|uniref:L-ascorbate metabolism protein UlaG, beta-lactamase superfamily n=1 Tax=Palleronia pelagia TaxID=387096 RepID=A0A1H8DQP7_9RHOB|nr:MBL fold metallo-hydrolase [Palleronia pelagia]SEN08837.1 L-ascorbate metabolism protein UlaG, beta-lactamase superfamily [Palleronia pelagia]
MRKLLSLALIALAVPSLAAAQDRMPSHCIAIADAAPGIEYLHKASWREPIGDPYTVRLTYIDHSMFLIQAPDGTSAVTDYNGFIGGVDLVPDVATMNHAHSSHWTVRPDPRIPNLLEGWGDSLEPNLHDMMLGEMRVRNVPTDIRRGTGVEKFGNSIFVFEVGGLCIGHLGHLHHKPDDAQFAALGRLDVVMAAVDGGMTLDLPTMVETLKRLRSSVVIPMHWFGPMTLGRFLDDISQDFDVDLRDTSSMEVSLRNLPDRPTVVVLRPSFLGAE